VTTTGIARSKIEVVSSDAKTSCKVQCQKQHRKGFEWA